MTTNFTLRDFFVYLLTGLLCSVSFAIIFHEELFSLSLSFFTQYEFIKELAILIPIFVIPVVYLLGHVIGFISYQTLKLYIFINKKLVRPIPKWKYSLLMLLQIVLYRQRIIYRVIQYTKGTDTPKIFTNENEFWTLCAKMQIEGIYQPAEYWYILNELFNSVNIIFFMSLCISLITRHWILGVSFCLLAIFAFMRAKQYADHFVITVCRITTAKWLTRIG